MAGGRPYSHRRLLQLAQLALQRLSDNGCPLCSAPPGAACTTAAGVVCNDHKARAGAAGCTLARLYAVMFLCDMEAYRQLGRSITGATWVKVPWGVLPMRANEAKRFRRRLWQA